MILSTVDPDAAHQPDRSSKAKKPVKISAWKLAKLDAGEAARAAAKARASSSVLRPIDHHRPRLPTDAASSVDLASSDNASIRSSVGTDYDAHINPKPDHETGTPTASSRSSPARVNPNPVLLNPHPNQIPVNRAFGPRGAALPRASVVWDQEAGRYVSVAPSAVGNRAETSRASGASSRASGQVIGPERLTYTGQSIFFGGPLLGGPARDGSSSGLRAETTTERDQNSRRSEGRRDSFPVFAPGGGSQRN